MQRIASRVLSSFSDLRGFSLIEVLISATILSISVLALTRLELISIRLVNSAFLRSVTQTELQSKEERMLVERDDRIK